MSLGQADNILCGVKRFCPLYRNFRKKEGGEGEGEKEGRKEGPFSPLLCTAERGEAHPACCVVTDLDFLSLLFEAVVPSTF